MHTHPSAPDFESPGYADSLITSHAIMAKYLQKSIERSAQLATENNETAQTQLRELAAMSGHSKKKRENLGDDWPGLAKLVSNPFRKKGKECESSNGTEFTIIDRLRFGLAHQKLKLRQDSKNYTNFVMAHEFQERLYPVLDVDPSDTVSLPWLARVLNAKRPDRCPDWAEFQVKLFASPSFHTWLIRKLTSRLPQKRNWDKDQALIAKIQEEFAYILTKLYFVLGGRMQAYRTLMASPKHYGESWLEIGLKENNALIQEEINAENGLPKKKPKTGKGQDANDNPETGKGQDANDTAKAVPAARYVMETDLYGGNTEENIGLDPEDKRGLPPDREAELRELQTKIDEAKSQLTPRQRQILVLRIDRDQSLEQIATSLDISEETVKRELKKARAQLERLLDLPSPAKR